MKMLLLHQKKIFFMLLQLCHIDCQAEGGIPSYSFALMVIFFLQQRKPRILPSYLGSWVSELVTQSPCPSALGIISMFCAELDRVRNLSVGNAGT